MGVAFTVVFETSFNGTLGIAVSGDASGAELTVSSFGKTRQRVAIDSARFSRLRAELIRLNALPGSEGTCMLDGTTVRGTFTTEDAEIRWEAMNPEPETAPREYGWAWHLLEAAWEVVSADSLQLLLGIHQNFGHDLPHLPIVEQRQPDLCLAHALCPASPAQQEALDLWQQTLPETMPLVIEATQWAASIARSSKAWGPSVELLRRLRSRPGTAFVCTMSGEAFRAFSELAGPAVFTDFYGARAHVLFKDPIPSKP